MSSEGEGQIQVPQQSATIGVVKPFIVEPASRSNNDVAQESGSAGTNSPVTPAVIDPEVLLRMIEQQQKLQLETIAKLLKAVPGSVSEVNQAQDRVNSKIEADDNVEPSLETSSEAEKREEMRRTKEELEAVLAKIKNAPTATPSQPPQPVPETASAIPVPPPPPPPPPPPQLAESSSTPTLSKKATTAPADGKEADEKPSILLLNELKGAIGGGKTLKKTERIEKKMEKQEEEKFSIKFQLRPVRKSDPKDSPSKSDTISDENELVMKTFRRKSTTNESKKCEELSSQKPASELEEARQKMKKVKKNESNINSVQEITEKVKISSIPDPKPATTPMVTSTESEGKGQLNFKSERVLKRSSVSGKSASPSGNAGEQVNSMHEHMQKFFQKKAAKAKDNTNKDKQEEKAEVRTEEVKVFHKKADEVLAEFNVCPEERGTEVPNEQVVKVNVNPNGSFSGESSMGKTEIRSENLHTNGMDEQGKRNTVGQKNSTRPKPNKKPKSKSSPLNTRDIVTTTDGTSESVPVPLLPRPPPLPCKPKMEDIPPRGKSVELHTPTITVPPSSLSQPRSTEAKVENLEKTAVPLVSASMSATPPCEPKMEDIPASKKTVGVEVLTETTVPPPPPPPPPVPLHDQDNREVRITKSSFSSATSFKQVMSSNGTKTSYLYEESSVKEKFVQQGVPDSHSALFEQINRIRETGISFLRPVTTKAAENVRERVHTPNTPTSKANDIMDSIKLEIGKRFSSWNSNDSEDSDGCSEEEWDDEVEE